MNLNGEHPTISVARDLFLVLACIFALVLPFVLTRDIFRGDSASPRPRDAQPSAAQPGETSRDSTAVRTGAETSATIGGPTSLAAVAERCRLANLRQQAPLSAADVSLAQFDKHIDAMNLLVAGKISLAVATTFWDETRVKAVENAADFRRADKELAASGTGCPAPDPALANAAPYGQVVALKSCVSAISARNTALARARPAVTTWEHHVHDMEMLRMGHLTPAQATAAWHKNWKTGQKQLEAYEAAAAKARKIHCALD
ncbi:hypothetical protein [Phycicoccus sp. Soil802]|uniref:hypothetical protein n=1 Tax=Phycicoccus sp. Soil802 TaxID=1736414 RepID=UPI0007025784|nr:hypothetical protein [Phycicoccus sp. Soil802]KRF27424.1 hypothetical protein ASG91_13375 [Phycicoccus sp. Soil802]